MPASVDFQQRLEASLPVIAEHFGTPFYLYDELGIIDGITTLREAFTPLRFREFYAVKAVSNPRILDLLRRHGAGFDCGAAPDLTVARQAGATADDLIFTSNNTTPVEFAAARAAGALLNIDDLAAFGKLADLPDRVCFRLNPGHLPYGAESDLATVSQKFGLRPDQLTTAEQAARDRGARRFGLHAMVATGQLHPGVLLATLAFLLSAASAWRRETGTVVEFVDMGGGLGIPFRPDEKPFDVHGFGRATVEMVSRWATAEGVDRPALFLESGRYVTGPHGVLVTRVINRMDKWQTFIGVDTGVSAMIRPALYQTAYHHISVHGGDDRRREVVDVVGGMCENNDKLATRRELPRAEEGDLLYVHDVGAHGYAMSFPYNNRLRPQELLLRADGAVELIRRAETEADYFATLTYVPKVLPATVSDGQGRA
jgi:diaminopimelate decarboxylase